MGKGAKQEGGSGGHTRRTSLSALLGGATLHVNVAKQRLLGKAPPPPHTLEYAVEGLPGMGGGLPTIEGEGSWRPHPPSGAAGHASGRSGRGSRNAPDADAQLRVEVQSSKV